MKEGGEKGSEMGREGMKEKWNRIISFCIKFI